MAEGGRTDINLSEEAFDFICTACEREKKSVEAVTYCEDCKDYCCQQCTDLHKKVSLLFGHNFLDVGHGSQSGNQSTSLPEFPTERCCKHTGKVIDMYCQKHDSVGCHKCIATDHKSCPDSKIYRIPETLKVLFNSSDCKKTESRLKQMMTSLSKWSESKDTQLEALSESKENALEQVGIFQKALEGMVRQAADKSRKEIEEAFKNVKKEILEDKGNIDGTNNVLKDANDKLTKPVFNRAQRFVCSKLAETIIKDAEIVKAKQLSGGYRDVEITFHPENAPKDYIKALRGIGKVQIVRTKRNDLYRVKGSRDINIRVSDDTKEILSFGCCLISDQQLLVTDNYNHKLKRIDTKTMALVDHFSLDCTPFGVCLVNEKEVAIGCGNPNKIQFVSIENEMIPIRKIDTAHSCFGIALKNENIYVTDFGSSLYIYDMNGILLKKITNDNAGNPMFSISSYITFNSDGSKLFVGDYVNGISCFDENGNRLFKIKDLAVSGDGGLGSDGRGNIFVGWQILSTVAQCNDDGKKIGIAVNQNIDVLNAPTSLAFNPKDNRLFVTANNSDVLKVIDLK